MYRGERNFDASRVTAIRDSADKLMQDLRWHVLTHPAGCPCGECRISSHVTLLIKWAINTMLMWHERD